MSKSDTIATWPWSCHSPRELGRKDMQPEIDRLRSWIAAIGGLADVDADERGWMAEHALAGEPVWHPHGAQAQRTGSDEGEAPEGAGGALWCRSCGTVFTPPLEGDCERMGTPELRDAIPYTDDEPGGAL